MGQPEMCPDCGAVAKGVTHACLPGSKGRGHGWDPEKVFGYMFGVRLTAEQATRLHEKASAAGRSVEEYARDAVLKDLSHGMLATPHD